MDNIENISRNIELLSGFWLKLIKFGWGSIMIRVFLGAIRLYYSLVSPFPMSQMKFLLLSWEKNQES